MFSVTVPLAGAARTTWRPRPKASEGREFAGRTILVADDNEPVRRAMARILRDRGATVLEAATAEQALAVVGEAPSGPDGAVIDFNLENGTDGLALAERLTAVLGRSVPAVIVTGASDGTVHLRLAESGRPWLSKPVDPERLLAALLQAAAGARQHSVCGLNER